MKLLFLLLMPLFSSSQILHEKNGEIMYSDVVIVDSSLTKSELFNRAKMWFAMTYKSANDVIQMDDKDAGILIGKGIFVVNWSSAFIKNISTRVPHTIKLLLKDGKYKYEITDLLYEDEYGRPVDLKQKGTSKKFLYAVNEEVLNTIKDLKVAMSKPITVENF